MNNVLTTSALTKKYKRHTAVDGVCMNINRGDIYGFVGENGSGKTTVIRLITGLIAPTSGDFSLFSVSNKSKDIGRARSKVGAIVETPSIYLNMSAIENLKMQSIILGIKDPAKIYMALKEVGLEALYNDKKKAANFSLGMRQRLGIAMALIGDPEFIILDEPMNGLDPAGIVEIRELILKLNRERKITFLISSHILTELSLVATKYGIISKGKLIKEITAEELRSECTKSVIVVTDNPDKLTEIALTYCSDNPVQLVPEGLRIIGDVDLNHFLGKIMEAGLKILSINCVETSFEEYYLSLVGGGKRD